MLNLFISQIHSIKRLCSWLVILLLSCACASQAEIHTSSQTASPIPVNIPPITASTLAKTDTPPITIIPVKREFTQTPTNTQRLKSTMTKTKPPSPTIMTEVFVTPSPMPRRTNTIPPPTLTRAAVPDTGQEKAPQIFYSSLPGDGGWCMADYRGVTAPALVLYSDGLYLVQQSSGEASWFEEKQLNKEDVTVLLKRIENSGFFSVSGDGKMWEEDPIYQFPDDFEESQGAGTLSLEVEYGNLSKQVTIYIPYRNYLVPEIAGTLQILEEYIPRNMKPYRPKHWVAWVSREDPCPYDLQFRPWPDSLPNIQAFLNGAPEGQLVLQSNLAVNLNQLISSKPNTFIDKEGGDSYYIYTRPLLPHELPSDFCDDSC